MARITKSEEVEISKLKPYAKNAKLHSKDQVEKIGNSILEFGFLSPCLIDMEYNLIAGHGRVEAAKKIGLTKVPCMFVEGLSEAQYKAYVLADNRLTELGEWDMETVTSELMELDEMHFDISLTGFEIDLDELNADEVVEDELPEEVETRAKKGDVWKLGKHRLMCGDSTKIEDVQKLCGEDQMDLLLTDPPYGVSYVGKTKDALKIENDSMEKDEFIAFLKNAFEAADSVMKPGAVFYIWHADSKSYEFRMGCELAGWEVRQCLIWVKNRMVLGRQDYQWKHEPCLYGWKSGAGHLWSSDRKQTTVLEFDKPSRNGEHPTMKPIPLFDYQIKNNTKGGDKVLDLFGGSGTTIMACEQNGRIGYSMEFDEHYCDVIIQRWENFTGLKAELLEE